MLYILSCAIQTSTAPRGCRADRAFAGFASSSSSATSSSEAVGITCTHAVHRPRRCAFAFSAGLELPYAPLTCPLLPTPLRPCAAARARWAFRAVWLRRCRAARCPLDSLEQLTAVFAARQGLRRTLSTTTVTSSLSILSNTAPMPSFENLSFLNAFIT